MTNKIKIYFVYFFYLCFLSKQIFCSSFLKRFSFNPSVTVSSQNALEKGLSPTNKENIPYTSKTNKNNILSQIKISYQNKKKEAFLTLLMQNNLKNPFSLFGKQQETISENSLQNQTQAIDFIFSYEIMAYLRTGIKSGRVLTRKKIVLTGSLFQSSPLKKVDRIYFIPYIQIKSNTGGIKVFSILEQEINSQKEFSHQNFSFSDQFFSFGLIYTFSINELLRSSIGFFQSQNQYNDPSYDSTKNIFLLKLSSNLSSRISSSTTFSQLSEINKNSEKLNKELNLSLTYSYSRYHDFKLNFLLSNQIDSAIELDHKIIFEFLMSYTFNFF